MKKKIEKEIKAYSRHSVDRPTTYNHEISNII